MDIFTTQLTRVVPVPIKPTNLKVKALVKDAAATKLKEDPDHLENHEYYFKKSDDEDSYQGENSAKKDEQPEKKLVQDHSTEKERNAEESKGLSLGDADELYENVVKEGTANNAKVKSTDDEKNIDSDDDDHKGHNLDLYA